MKVFVVNVFNKYAVKNCLFRKYIFYFFGLNLTRTEREALYVSNQGWSIALWFFVQIALVLTKKS